MMRRLLVAASLLAACAGLMSAPGADAAARRARPLVTWKVQGETFRTYVRRADVAAVRRAIREHRQVGIPTGSVVRGTRENRGHAWHLENVRLVEVTIELCDGRPSDLDADLAYWAGTVKRFCPWSARPVRLRLAG